ncbi:MAG: hypothetical protein R2795_19490 [Saprospiraceae bacterium]
MLKSVQQAMFWVLQIHATFDQINNDPVSGLPNSPADDCVLGDGTGLVNSGDAAGDEDDHDLLR